MASETTQDNRSSEAGSDIISVCFFTAAEGLLGALVAESASSTPESHLAQDSALHHLTFCVVELTDGRFVIGQSMPDSGDSFDTDSARNCAFQAAMIRATKSGPVRTGKFTFESTSD